MQAVQLIQKICSQDQRSNHIKSFLSNDAFINQIEVNTVDTLFLATFDGFLFQYKAKEKFNTQREQSSSLEKSKGKN